MPKTTLTPNQIINDDYTLDINNVYEARAKVVIEWFKEFLTGDPTVEKAHHLIRVHQRSYEHKPKVFNERWDFGCSSTTQAYHVLHYLCKPVKHGCGYDKQVDRIIKTIRDCGNEDVIYFAYCHHTDRVMKEYLNLWIKYHDNPKWPDFQLTF